MAPPFGFSGFFYLKSFYSGGGPLFRFFTNPKKNGMGSKKEGKWWVFLEFFPNPFPTWRWYAAGPGLFPPKFGGNKGGENKTKKICPPSLFLGEGARGKTRLC